MKFQATEEQKVIKDCDSGLLITACAGAGKTSTFVLKAKNHPKDRFLYLSFNKSIQLEAEKKFPKNTDCRTVHSLAYKHLGVSKNYELAKYGMSPQDIKDFASIVDENYGDSYWGYKIAYMVKFKYMTYCNSDYKSLDELDLSFILDAGESQVFFSQNEDIINDTTQKLWDAMDKKEIPITHDFYVKKYSLEAKDLGYDWILVDEAQDISPCFIDIIKKQNGKKLICGDFSQAIYGWRSGVGNFSKYFPELNEVKLSSSFRFRPDVADLCNRILSLKGEGYQTNLLIQGQGNSNELKTKAIIARTNATLLNELLGCMDVVESIYIEGGINSILSVDGFSVFDVLYLLSGKKDKIKSPFIKKFKNFEDLVDFANDIGAGDLRSLLSIVKSHRTELFQHIINIKGKCVERKKDADIVFSTVHKAKGLEYDIVSLAAGDFIGEEEIRNLLIDYGGTQEVDHDFINEEVNILYVAASRAKNKLIIPEIFSEDKISDYLGVSHAQSMNEFLASPVF